MHRHRFAARLAATLAFAFPEATAQTPLHVFDGDSILHNFAEAVDGAGDVDGDGHDDVIAGIPGFDDPVVNIGAARVFSGKDGSILHEFVGGASGDQFGSSVSGAGDVDNDGFADVIAGTPLVNGQAGRARVHSGKTGALLHTFDGGFFARFGFSVSEAGDVDGDGHDDVVVGAPNSGVSFVGAGSVFVHSGKTGAVLHAFDGLWFNHNLGHSVSGAGDVDNDGRADVIGGAPFADGPMDQDPNAGMAIVWSGATGGLLHVLHGADDADRFGSSVSSAGDVDGDGHDDIVGGAPLGDLNGAPASSGYARVYSGATGALLHSFVGGSAGARLGDQVAGLGDVDGDGRGDILVTGPNGADLSGVVRVYSGATGATLVDLVEVPLEQAGRSAGAAGDVNNDGTPDFVVNSHKNAGSAWVRSGKSIAPPIPTFGQGCPGTGGVTPTLEMIGSTAAGGHLSLFIDDGVWFSPPGLLLVGVSEVSVPAGCGCTLLVSPLVQAPLTLIDLGCLLVGFDLPPGLGGATIKLQALIADAGAACGLSATNGVSVTFQ